MRMVEEVWRDIDGYEGRYMVSNLGHVRSMNFRNHGYPMNITPKVNNDGRLWVLLYKDRQTKPMLIHRLVAMAFIPNCDNLPQVNHKDENPKNNCVENLEWCTAKYNVEYSLQRHPERRARPWLYGLYGVKKKRKRNQPIAQINSRGEIVKVWEDSRTIMLETGMSDWSISECCRGKRKTAYGFRWRYST